MVVRINASLPLIMIFQGHSYRTFSIESDSFPLVSLEMRDNVFAVSFKPNIINASRHVGWFIILVFYALYMCLAHLDRMSR